MPPYQLEQKLFERRYCCPSCGQPFAGVAPQLSLHLAIRAQVHEIEAAFKPVMAWWVASRQARKSTSMFRSCFGRWIDPDRERDVEDLIMSATLHSVPAPKHLAAPKYPGVMVLPLQIKVEASLPRFARFNSNRRRIDDQEAPYTVYMASVRVLQRWILRHHDVNELPEPSSLNRVVDYPSRVLALLCLRWQFEKHWVGTTKWWVTLQKPKFIEFPPFWDHTYNGRIPRLAWRALFVAHYAAWYHIVQQARGSSVEDLLARFAKGERVKGPQVHGRFALTEKSELRDRYWIGGFIFPEVEFLDQVFTPRARRHYRLRRSSGSYPLRSQALLI
ncbi:hypothetical protein [Massilia horti]|uniref:Uncharacterized protein n=1 Tax=Massilia horti TaxID=2562153 RepID=A0A4Y9SYF4_9BURK|nr:hypothetical protein [Massilia horti]TFW31777.1 hypothetical protein E4O92_12580 [Massilia horti]